jgi:hypothetical protein
LLDGRSRTGRGGSEICGSGSLAASGPASAASVERKSCGALKRRSTCPRSAPPASRSPGTKAVLNPSVQRLTSKKRDGVSTTQGGGDSAGCSRGSCRGSDREGGGGEGYGHLLVVCTGHKAVFTTPEEGRAAQVEAVHLARRAQSKKPLPSSSLRNRFRHPANFSVSDSTLRGGGAGGCMKCGCGGRACKPADARPPQRRIPPPGLDRAARLTRPRRPPRARARAPRPRAPRARAPPRRRSTRRRHARSCGGARWRRVRMRRGSGRGVGRGASESAARRSDCLGAERLNFRPAAGLRPGRARR